MEVLLGGMVTLVVTVIVQVLVIPRVQAHARNLERWENDVVALRTLIEEELPEAGREVRFAADAIKRVESLRGDADYDQRGLEDVIREQRDRLRSARQRWHELASQLPRLEGRASLLNRRDTYWVKLSLARMNYTAVISDVTFKVDAATIRSHEEGEVDSELRSLWARVDGAHDQLASVSRVITRTTKPPPRWTVRKLYRRTRARLRKRLKALGGKVRSSGDDG